MPADLHTSNYSGHFTASYAQFVLRYRYFLMAIITLLTILAATQIHKIDIRNDPDTLLPSDNYHVRTNAYVEENFGMGNLMVLGVENLTGDIYQPWFVNKIVSIHKKLEGLPSARPYNYISIAAKKVRYIKGTLDGLDIRRLVPRNGISEDDPDEANRLIEQLRTGLEENPVILDMLLSKDKRSTFLITDFDEGIKANYLDFIDQVDEILQQESDERIRIYVAGEPYFLAAMIKELKNHWYLFVLSALLVALVLFIESRRFRATLLPLIGVSISVIWTLGLMGATEYKLTTMMILTPVLVFAVGIGHSIQVIRRFNEEHLLHNSHMKAAQRAITHTITPASMAVVTDVLGFMVLFTEDISFYRAYAMFGLFGMISLLLTCTTLVPILATVVKLPKPNTTDNISRWENELGQSLTNIISGPLKWVPIFMVLAVLSTSAYYIPKIERGINYPEAAFKQDTKPIEDLHALNARMPGVISFNIPFIGKEDEAMQDVNLLRGINQLELALREDPAIGFTTSLSQYMHLLTFKIMGESKEMWAIPYDQELVKQYLFVYSLGADSEDMAIVTDYDYRNGQLLGFINTTDPAELDRVTKKIANYIKLYRDNRYFEAADISLSDEKTGLPGIGGFAGTSAATRDVSEKEWLKLPLTTAILIAIVIAILFRSITMAGLIMLMVGITLIAQYGLAGYLSSIKNWGGNLHFGNLVALSIGMGLGIDYSIYLAERIKDEYRKSQDILTTFRQTFITTGSSALLSVMVLLVCLIPLMFTSLANTWGLSVYIAVAIIVSVFSAMTILPILIRATVNLPLTLTESSNLLNLQVSERTLQLQKEKDSLNSALQLLQETQEQLVEAEKMASLGGLVAGVAHEINTPLGNATVASTHLKEEVSLIKKSILNDELTRSALDDFLDNTENATQLLYNNLERASNLVQSFKQVATDQSIESNRLFNLKEYTDEVLNSIKPKFRRTHINITSICSETTEINADPGIYAQILSNLLMNSLIHGFEVDQPGEIVIDIQESKPGPKGEKVLLLIYIDNGKGMDDETRLSAFEPFFTTRRGEGGSGLGLHIVYNLVTQGLKGKISLESAPDKGVRFEISIPMETTESTAPK
jgi:predicted RND superfamily exporter protein/nitrogen-specific signal transduction histidine kinase